MTDEEKIELVEETKAKAEEETADTPPVQANTEQQPVKDKDGKIYTYVSLGCGIAALVFLAIFGLLSIACSIVGIVMSNMAIKHGYKDDLMRKIGFVLSCVAIGITIIVTIFSIIMLIASVGLVNGMMG